MSLVIRLFALLFAVTAAAETSLLSNFTIRRWGVEDGLPESRVVAVEQGGDGYLWCATPNYLLRFDGVQFTKMPARQLTQPPRAAVTNLPTEVTADSVTATMTEADGTLWVGTMHGVYRWQAGAWSDLTPRDGVFPCDARCFALDRENNVWIGTSGGLLRLRRKRVTTLRSGLSVSSESVTALVADSPSSFHVGLAGLGLLAGAPGALRPAQVGTLRADTTVSSLLRGGDGTLWIGTQGDGLWRRRPDGDVSLVRLKERGGMMGRGISALLEDRNGRLWVGTWRGLMQVNDAGALVPVSYRVGEMKSAEKPLDMVHSLLEDRTGAVWVAYQDFGLVCFRPENRVERFQQKDGLPDGAILVLHEDSAGVLWIGTTRGLARWRGTERHRFTTANGLADDVILQILEDDAGDLWIGTRRGLMRVRKSEFEEIIAGRKTVMAARQLGLEAGMADEECTGRLGARAAKTVCGRLWFPTMDGIVVVDPKKIPGPPDPPRVYVEEIHANDGLMPWRGGDLRLPMGMREVEIFFTAPVFTAPERAHFKFQLEGHDTDWSRASTDRSVRYSRLAAGTYRFRVMARDRDSAWSEPTPPLTLIVPPFFWETAWFIWVATITTLALVIVIVRLYYRRRGMRELLALEHANVLERERARIARDIHDEVGAGLTEVAMLSELAHQDEAHPVQLREHLDGIFRRAHAMIQSLNEIVWAINPVNDTLESLLSYIADFAQEFLGAANLACRLELPPDPPPLAISSGMRHHLCLAVKEVLHNTVKHAGATEVHLSVTLAGRELTLAIRDNGRGFPAEAVSGPEAGRDGLTNLRARLLEVRGRLLQENVPGGGSRTVLSVAIPTDATGMEDAR
ncbi:MAG: hypothetical protein FJ395_09145 [Verrucomicrobia bacterium]|nr:hypothetical protein [Verrucomicrobiota bacterium]